MSYVGANSSEASGEQMGVCDVHRILEGDTTPRRVTFCGMCKAWMCYSCKWNPARRALAAIKARMNRG